MEHRIPNTNERKRQRPCHRQREKEEKEEKQGIDGMSKQKHKFKWQYLNNSMMEAMILLDPPPQPPSVYKTKDSTFVNARKAYDILLSALDQFENDFDTDVDNNNNTDVDVDMNTDMDVDTNTYTNTDEEDDATETNASDLNFSFCEKIRSLADLYRALILSSSLLLEMCCDGQSQNTSQRQNTSQTGDMNAHEYEMNVNGNGTGNGNGNDYITKILCQTVQRSILLLQRLSHITYLATNVYSISSMPSSSSSSSNDNQKRTIHNTILSLYQQHTHSHTHSHDNSTNSPKTPTSGSTSTSAPMSLSMSIGKIQDWHDKLLPKSQHPLIQECFMRKELTDVETGLVFGCEERLISLSLEDYHYWEWDEGCGWGEEGMDMDVNVNSNLNSYDIGNVTNSTSATTSNRNNDWQKEKESQEGHQHQEQHEKQKEHGNQKEYEYEYENDTSQHVSLSLSFNVKEIEKEEEMLLNIAFPDYANDQNANERRLTSRTDSSCNGRKHQSQSQNQHNQHQNQQVESRTSNGNSGYSTHHASNEQFKLLPSPVPIPTQFLHTLKEKDLFKYIQIPFTTNATYPLLKQGQLIRVVHTKENNDNYHYNVHVWLFSNGIFILSPSCEYDNSAYVSSLKAKKEAEAAMTEAAMTATTATTTILRPKNDFIVYSISNETKKCSPIIHSNTFHFQLDHMIRLFYDDDDDDGNHSNVTEEEDSNMHSNSIIVGNDISNNDSHNDDDCNESKSSPKVSMTFAIDKEKGGNFLMESWKWVSTLDNCIEVVGGVNGLCKIINDHWI